MADNITTRRALLRASTTAAVAAIAFAPAIGATAVPIASGIRPEFLAAEQLFRRLEAESAAYERRIAEPARQRWLAAVAALPHTSATFDTGETVTTLTTANPAHMAVARFLNTDARSARNNPGVAAARKLLAASLRRERAAERLPETAAQRAQYAHGERLTDQSITAEDAFYAMRPASLAELAHKLRVMAERQRDYEGCIAEIITPEVLALATREA